LLAVLSGGTLLALMAAGHANGGTIPPIDDFEVGGFSLQSGTIDIEQDVPIPGYNSHSIVPQRTISLYPEVGIVRASLDPGSAPNDFAEVTVEGDGRCWFEYAWGFPADLTFGGQVDRIELQVRGAGGSELICSIADSSFAIGWVAELENTSATQTITWPLSQWDQTPTDVTRAIGLSLGFRSGDFEVEDIRFRSTGSEPVDFIGDIVATQLPGVPTPPLVFRTFNTFGHPLYTANVSIRDALTDGQTVPEATWTWNEFGALGGEAAQMSFLWSDPNIQETNFSFDFLVSAANGWTPSLYPPDPIHGPESILLNFPVTMRDGSGVIQGTSQTWLSFDFAPIQGVSLEFQEVSVTPILGLRGSFSGFTLSFRMAYGCCGSPEYNFPLFTATWLSDWTASVPTEVVAIEATTPDASALRLTASPSVTRAGTEIRASRPFPRDGTMTIYDLRGRAVRSLPVARGMRSVHWDGNSVSGAPAVSGVYFARITGSAGGEAARIVRIR
jgi:hypothetical protein